MQNCLLPIAEAHLLHGNLLSGDFRLHAPDSLRSPVRSVYGNLFHMQGELLKIRLRGGHGQHILDHAAQSG